MSFISRILASVAILALTLGLTSFYVQATVYAPEQTRAAVATVLDDPAARNLVASHLVSAVSAVLPDELEAALPAGALEGAADTAVRDPRLVASASDAVVSAHEVAIGESDVRPVLDASSASAAFADAVRPVSGLAADQVAAQPIVVEIPVREIPAASFFNSLTAKVAFPLTALGAVLAAAAIALSPRRDRTMRRIGVFLVSLTVLQALVFWILPNFVAPRIDSGLVQMVGTVLATLGAQAIPYVVGGLVGGVALIAAAPLLRSRPAAPVRREPVAPVRTR